MLNEHPRRSSQAASLKDEVLSAWLQAVQREIPHARGISTRALVDNFPELYQYIVSTVVGESSKFDYATLASDHGGQRARVTRFDAGSIGHEFQLFRSAISEIWRQSGMDLDLGEIRRFSDAIDIALRESLTGFSLAQIQIREQFFSALTHDLRTPLSTASAAVSVIQKTSYSIRTRNLSELTMRQHAMIDKMLVDLLNMMVMNS